MAFLTDDDLDPTTLGPALAASRPLIEPTPIPKAPQPKSRDSVLDAAFRQENLIGAAIAKLSAPHFEGTTFDKDFSPRRQARLDGIGEHADRFNNVRNREHYNHVKSKIEQELRDQKTLSDNGFKGLAASVFAGLADPISLATLFVPGVGIGRAASFGGRMLSYAGRGSLEAAASEIPLNLLQETHGVEQSAVAIAGGAIVHSLLGTAADKISKKRKDALIKDIQTSLGPQAEKLDNVGAARVSPTGSDSASRLKTNVGMRAVDAIVENTGLEGVGMTVAKSENGAIRRAGQALAIDVLQREGDQAAPVSAELLVRASRADLQEFARTLRDSRKSLDGLGELTDDDKGEIMRQLRSLGKRVDSIEDVTPAVVQRHLPELVAYAARNGDTHPVSQVAGAARVLRSIYDRDYARAVKLGLIEAEQELVGAPSYFTRVFNKQAVMQNQINFIQDLMPHIEAKLVALGENINQAEEIATTIANNIAGNGSGTATDIMVALTEKGKGKLAQRVLDVPDEVLAPYLENDASRVLAIYKRSVEPQLALKETTGYVNWQNFRDERLIPERDIEKQKLAAHVDMDDPAQVARLNEALAAYDARWQGDMSALEALWKRVEGRTEGPSSVVGKNLATAGRIARKGVSTVSLGGTVIASIPDIGRMVMTHGLTPLLKNWVARLTSKEFRDFSRETAERIGTAGELVLYKQHKMRRDMLGHDFDTELDIINPGRVERFVDNFAESFQHWSGAQWWNDTPRQMAAVLAEDRILRNADKGWGALAQKERDYLKVMGINEASLTKIKTATDGKVEKIGGFNATDPGEWADMEAARIFKLAALKDATTSINSPTAGTLPAWADHEVAKYFTQFKSFIFAAYQQTLLVGLQRADSEVLMGLLTMTALGMAVEKTRAIISGNDKAYDAAELVYKGIDRAGVASIPQEMFNVADKLGGSMFGENFMPYGGSSRYKERGLSDLLGPTVGYGDRVFNMTQDVAKDGDLDKPEKAVSLLPYQNLWGFKPALAALEYAKGQTDYIDRVVNGFKNTFPGMDFDETKLEEE